MGRCYLAAAVTVIATGWLAPPPASGQSRSQDATGSSTWTVPRTPDGRPDLQGYWTTQTFTPLERPDHLGGKEFFTEEETAELQQQFTADSVDPLARFAIDINLEDPNERERVLDQTHRDETYVHYDNSIWLRTRVPKGLSSRRTSLITDPPDGQVPPLTPEAEQRLATSREARQQRGAFYDHTVRPLSERCVAWPHNGPPMLPTAYNDVHQIFQTPDYVVLFTELNNSLPRIIPLDERPPISNKIRLMHGDSRGYWEGDVLVVESRHFTDKTRFQGSGETLHVVERFSRVAADRILYEFTVDDPTSWTSAWSAEIPMVTTEGPVYEYACHEGNYDVRHLLEINRTLEKQEKDKKASGETELERGQR